MSPGRTAATLGALLIVAGLTATAGAQTPRPAPPAARPAPATPARPAPAPSATPRPAEPAKKDDNSQPVTVDADKMDRFGKESLIIFTGNVIARQNNSVQYADRMEVYLDEKGDRIARTISTGSVRIITKDCKTGTAKRVEYFDLEQRMVLIGNARVWQEDNVVTGDTITIFLSQDRSVVQSGKQERVKAVFYPKSESASAPAPGPTPPGATPAVATPAKSATTCVN